MTALFVFLSGFAFECAYLLWIRYSVERKPLRSALLSMVTGALSVYATFSAVHDMRLAPALILGYGVGSYVVARIGAKSINISGNTFNAPSQIGDNNVQHVNQRGAYQLVAVLKKAISYLRKHSSANH